jgi:hypothetical protein
MIAVAVSFLPFFFYDGNLVTGESATSKYSIYILTTALICSIFLLLPRVAAQERIERRTPPRLQQPPVSNSLATIRRVLSSVLFMSSE